MTKPVLKVCFPRVILKSSEGWREFIRNNRGSLMVAPMVDRPAALMRPNGWAGRNGSEAGPPAWLARCTEAIARLRPQRAVLGVLRETTGVCCAVKRGVW